MGMRQSFGGSRPPKYLTHMDASTILRVYTPLGIDAYGYVNLFGGLDPQIIEAWGCVNYFRGPRPPNN